MTILNVGGFIEKIPKDTVVGKAVEACPADYPEDIDHNEDITNTRKVKRVNSSRMMDDMETQEWKKLLLEILGELNLPPDKKTRCIDFFVSTTMYLLYKR